MSTASPPLMTVEDLIALPDDDGVDRELVRGELRERAMTRRNRFHAATEACVAYCLKHWQKQSGEPGKVVSGEAGCILRRNPDTSVGIDAAFFSHDVVSRQTDETTMFDGPPVLAVEILSSSDTYEDVCEKVREYLETGVLLVWVVDPVFHTVTVHRPDESPQMFNDTERLSGDPELPGFDVAVSELFE